MAEESRATLLDALAHHLKETSFSPGVHHLDILHDDDCGIFQGHACDCEPSIVSGPLIDAKYEGRKP